MERTWAGRETLVAFGPGIILERTIRLEAKAGSGEVTIFEAGTLRRAIAAFADGIGLSLAEGKALPAELQQCIVQSQVDEFVASVRACADCLTSGRLRAAMVRRHCPGS